MDTGCALERQTVNNVSSFPSRRSTLTSLCSKGYRLCSLKICYIQIDLIPIAYISKEYIYLTKVESKFQGFLLFLESTLHYYSLRFAIVSLIFYLTRLPYFPLIYFKPTKKIIPNTHHIYVISQTSLIIFDHLMTKHIKFWISIINILIEASIYR